MPRLPTAADLGARPVVSGAPMRAPPVSGATGEAMQYAGRRLTAMGDDLAQARLVEEDRADTLRAEDTYNKHVEKVLDLTEGQNGYRHVKGAALLGRDVHTEYLNQFDESVKQLDSSLANDKQRGKFKQRADFARLQFRRDLLGHIGREGDAAAKEVYDNSLRLESRNAAAHWQEPMSIGVSLARLNGLVDQEADRSSWSPEKRAFERMRVGSEAHANVVEQALVNDDYAYGADYFKRVQKELDPDTSANIQRALNGKRNEIEAEGRQRQALARLDLAERERDEVTSYKEVGNFQGDGLTRQEYVAAYGAEDGPKRFERLQKYRQAGPVVQALALANPQQRAEILAKHRPEPKEGFAENLGVYGVIVEAAQEQQKAREADPAGYVTRFVPSVQRSFDAMLKTPDDPQTAQDYVRAVRAASAELGLKNDGVLPKPLVESIAASIEDQPAGKSAAAAAIAQSKLWGDQWPWVWKQLSAKLPDSTYNVTAYADKESPDGRNVSALLDRGYALTAGTDGSPAAFKLKGGADGKTGLEDAFSAFVGDVFIGDAVGRQRALSGVTAAYAAYAEQRPDGLTGVFDEGTFKLAAQAYFGTKSGKALKINGGSVFAPYGMDEDHFTAGLFADASNKLKGVYSDEQVLAITKNAAPQKFGDGYILRSGDAYVSDASGQPIVFKPIDVPPEAIRPRPTPGGARFQ